MYTENEARNLVIQAGLMLLEKKLIARTWGNISARISDTEFVCTPSGRAYDSLKPEELVKVKIEDCSYEGNIKPTSEKGMHAGVYKLRKDINFVIHTHQLYASAICVEEKDVPFAPCAAYGLSGTDKLRDNVMLCIAIHPEYKAFLLARHGALCLGETLEDAFNEASVLEEKSRALFEERRLPRRKSDYSKPWIDDYAQLVGYGLEKNNTDDAEAVEMVTEKNRAAAQYARTVKPLAVSDVLIQRFGYRFKYSKLKNSNK